MTKAKSILAKIVVGILSVGIFMAMFVSSIGYSIGTHTGIVTATQDSGIIWQTKRVYIKTSPDSTQEDEYCVLDDEMYKELTEKSKTGERVTLSYSHPFITWAWECAGESDIINGIGCFNLNYWRYENVCTG